jgi:hypothetical protein
MLNRNTKSGFVVSGALIAGAMIVACGNSETKVDDKEAYDSAIKEITPKVALIAAYKPYLDKPKVQKYDPEKRSDLDRSCSHAANEIRHAANGASQRAVRSKSPVVKALSDEFATLAKACADLEGDEAIAKCKDAVNKLDSVLQDHASKAAAAGATGKFPRVSEEFITEDAKASIKLYLQAIGPGQEEAKYLAMRRDPKAETDALVQGCDAAAAEAGATMAFMGKSGNEDVRKVSAHHKAAVDGQCNRVKKDDELKAECVLACSKTKGRIKRGIPAAPFEQLIPLDEEICKDLREEAAKD